MNLSIEIVSDVICPWCFIGKRRFEKALRLLPPDLELEVCPGKVHWRPFQLNPGMPPEGIERKLYRTRKFGSWARSLALDAQLVEAGAGEGIEFAFHRMQRTPNTFDAHRVIWLAGKEGVQDAVVEALFQAYFVEAQDVGDRSVLERIAAASALDARELLAGDRGREEVRAEETWARQQGVEGVPLFLINRDAIISGAQSPESIAATLRRVLPAGTAAR